MFISRIELITQEEIESYSDTKAGVGILGTRAAAFRRTHLENPVGRVQAGGFVPPGWPGGRQG